MHQIILIQVMTFELILCYAIENQIKNKIMKIRSKYKY